MRHIHSQWNRQTETEADFMLGTQGNSELSKQSWIQSTYWQFTVIPGDLSNSKVERIPKYHYIVSPFCIIHYHTVDEAEHNVRKVDDVYRLKPNEKTLPIRFRDENNFLIISDLEVYKNGDLDTLAPRRPAPRSTKDSLLFSRNWPMTEKNKGKSFQEFIRR